MSSNEIPKPTKNPISKTSTQGLYSRSLYLLVAVVFTHTALAIEADWPFETSLAVLETTPLERYFDGTVEAVHQATVSSQTSGRIAEVYYDVDDFVEAGSTLIRFTDVEQQTAFQQAEAVLKEARARQVEAGEEYRRAQNLEQRGLGSQRDLDRSLASRDAAEARVSASLSALEAARQQVEYTLVRAPYAGIVIARHVETGEAVTTGQALMSGLSLEQLRVVVELPQQVALQLRGDPRAVVLVDDERVTPEKITIFPVADPVTNTFTVRLELPGGRYGLYPGMFVKVAFQVSESERLLVPLEAIIHRSEVTAVYIVTGDDVRLRQVRVGQIFADRVEVLAGIQAGDQVALDPVKAGIFIKTRGMEQQP